MNILQHLAHFLRNRSGSSPDANVTVHYPIKTILHWLWDEMKHNRLQAFLNTSLGVGTVLLDLLFVWLTKLTIDIATGQRDDISFSLAAVLLIVTILIEIALAFFSRWVRAILGVKAQNQMQRRLFAHVLLSRWSGMEKFHSGDVLNRIEKDVGGIVAFVTESMPSLITVIVRFTGAFVFLFLMDRMLACAVVIILPFFILLSKMYVKKMRELSRSVRQSDSKIQAIIQESLQHRTVVKALELSTTLIGRLESVQSLMHSQVKERTKYSSVSATIMNLGFAAGYLFAFLWGAFQLQQHAITYGALIAFIQLVGQIQGPARSLTGYIPVFINTFTASERLMELENIPREGLPGKKAALTGICGIRLAGVSYQYDQKGPVINRLSYTFPPGSSTAIVGETGAGKTTLIRLMLGLIYPQNGTIEIYNSSGTVKVGTATRGIFAYVPQGNTLLSGSIRDNLLLGNPDATKEELEKALRLACADFVFELPEQMETLCGEHGYGLSEGQAQRLCIARALLRPGSVILLDEATSALDSQTELSVLDNIRTHYKQKTLIMVSHRESALRYCDQTLHLERLKR